MNTRAVFVPGEDSQEKTQKKAAGIQSNMPDRPQPGTYLKRKKPEFSKQPRWEKTVALSLLTFK